MTHATTYKQLHTVKRWLSDRNHLTIAVVLFLCFGLIIYASIMQNRRLAVDPASYNSLLTLIAQAESGGNYNAHFGNANNTATDFTSMSIAQIRAWQVEYLKQGNPSNAVGRYQLLSTTFDGLVRKLKLDDNQKFDQALQDRLAITLLERRGSIDYVNNRLSRDQFAANLAQEWAALPKMIGQNPDQSYYASDGLNKSRVGVNEIRSAIEPIQAK